MISDGVNNLTAKLFWDKTHQTFPALIDEEKLSWYKNTEFLLDLYYCS